MALRRISDLQNLASTYNDRPMTSKLNDCLIEVSYADPASPRAYQSFCLSVSELAKLSPTDNFVTLDGNQTITGIKTFANGGGVVVNGDNGIIVNNGSIKGSTNLSGDISSAIEPLSVVPTTWAVKTYLSSEYLPLTAFSDNSGDIQDAVDAIDSLKGLLNKHNLVIYVHKDSPLSSIDNIAIRNINSTGIKGIFDNRDPEPASQKAVSSIYLAIQAAKKLKFLEDGTIWIWLLSDCALNEPGKLYKSLVIEHPDISGSKSIHINGGSLPNYKNQPGLKSDFTLAQPWTAARYYLRKITIDLKDPRTTNDQWNLRIINIGSPTRFEFIIFDGNLTDECFTNAWALSSQYQRGIGAISNGYSHAAVDIYNCYFTGHNYGMTGGNYHVYDVGFDHCYHACACFGGEINFSNGVNVVSCYAVGYSSNGSPLTIRGGDYPAKMQIFCGNSVPITMNRAGIVNYLFSNTGSLNTQPIGLSAVENGPISIDNATYISVSQSDIANGQFDIINPHIVTMGLGQYTKGQTTPTRYHPSSTSSIDIGNFLKTLGGLSSSGYTNNGHVTYEYINAKYLSCYTNTPYCYDFDHRWLPCVRRPVRLMTFDDVDTDTILSAIDIDNPTQYGPFKILKSTDVFTEK